MVIYTFFLLAVPLSESGNLGHPLNITFVGLLEKKMRNT